MGIRPSARRIPLAALLVLVVAAPRAAADGLVGPSGDQWALQAPALDAPSAWALGGTGAGTTVAVLDTGIDASHPDLRDALWANPGEVPGNGVDDDRDGWVDDVHGVDLVHGDGDPADDEGHGTHVTGLIAARSAAGDGVEGLAPGARIMAVKVLDERRAGSTEAVAGGIAYALVHGADVINVSVNGDALGRALEAALAAADAVGVPVVASAGNDAHSLDDAPSYPAAAPSVLAVAGLTREGTIAPFSNTGPRTVDLAAPAVAMESTRLGGGYELRSGTSMAAPLVSATLALMHGLRPDLPGAQLVATLRATADRPPALAGLLRSGALDPVAALRAVAPPERLAAIAAAAAPPSLSARVARRARVAGRPRAGRRARASRVPAPRLLVTWRVEGPTTRVARFEVRAGGQVLSGRGPEARGAWLRTRAAHVRLVALDDEDQPLAQVVVRLRAPG